MWLALEYASCFCLPYCAPSVSTYQLIWHVNLWVPLQSDSWCSLWYGALAVSRFQLMLHGCHSRVPTAAAICETVLQLSMHYKTPAIVVCYTLLQLCLHSSWYDMTIQECHSRVPATAVCHTTFHVSLCSSWSNKSVYKCHSRAPAAAVYHTVFQLPMFQLIWHAIPWLPIQNTSHCSLTYYSLAVFTIHLIRYSSLFPEC